MKQAVCAGAQHTKPHGKVLDYIFAVLVTKKHIDLLEVSVVYQEQGTPVPAYAISVLAEGFLQAALVGQVCQRVMIGKMGQALVLFIIDQADAQHQKINAQKRRQTNEAYIPDKVFRIRQIIIQYQRAGQPAVYINGKRYAVPLPLICGPGFAADRTRPCRQIGTQKAGACNIGVRFHFTKHALCIKAAKEIINGLGQHADLHHAAASALEITVLVIVSRT